MLTTILVAALFGNLTLLFLDPLTIIFRTLSLVIWPAADQVVTANAFGVAVAIQPFMMMEDDRALPFGEFQGLDDIGSHLGVFLDQGPLFRGQFSWFLDAGEIDDQLADIVKQGAEITAHGYPKRDGTREIRADLEDRCNAIMGDPTQIHQVLMNLYNNSAYSLKETGGTITVASDNIEIVEENTSGYPGLPPGKYLRLLIVSMISGGVISAVQ